jgi:hypothetical protein
MWTIAASRSARVDPILIVVVAQCFCFNVGPTVTDIVTGDPSGPPAPIPHPV